MWSNPVPLPVSLATRLIDSAAFLVRRQSSSPSLRLEMSDLYLVSDLGLAVDTYIGPVR